MERTTANVAGADHVLGDESHQGIFTLPTLTEFERQQALADSNNTAATFPESHLCLHQLIEAQAARTPDQPALVYEQQRLTYGELDHRAKQLARHLLAMGAGPDAPVGLFVDRSLDMIIGILGILSAGAPYLPIDTALPQERTAFILDDAKARVVVTQTGLARSLPGGDAQVVYLDTFDWSGREGDGQSGARVRPEDLAYVIYTSGSTGRPKGVCVEHRNIVNYVLGIVARFRLPGGLNYATVSTVAADLGNTVIFPALVTGGCLHVISQRRAEDPAMFSDYFQRECIDVLKIVPSHLAALLSGRNPERAMPRTMLILGGESSRLDWIQQLRAWAPHCEIYNHYGPTETTVGVLTYHVGGELPQTQSGTLPIGRPLPNCRVYILDERGYPVPNGVEGELYIGGKGVARGYLNRPDLTAEKFIPDPFSPDPGGSLYRTGDRARFLPDGNVEFLGRLDDQVKIHGYRIELGEIDSELRGHRGVQDVVVTARDNDSGDKQVVAYLVPRRQAQALWNGERIYVLPDGSPVSHLNRSETDYIYNEIFVLQAYLRHGITINDGDCIVDAGANIGLFTVFANRLAGNLRVIAFEPNPAAYACLKANAEAYGTNVKCLATGLSRENKSAELTFFEGMSLLSGFYADAAKEREVVKAYVANQQVESEYGELFSADLAKVIDDRFRRKTEKAQMQTLSSVMAEEGLNHIDLLKINVEKSELDVLMGIGSDDWAKIRQMVIEVDLEENLHPITSMLEEHGYEVLVEQDPLLKKTELCYVYAIRPGDASRLVRQQSAGAHVRALPPLDQEILAPITLRRYLEERLPKYMIPSAFVLMKRLPLTPNGKLDRKALPAPSFQVVQPVKDFILPRNETEKTLAAIWSDLLKVENIGVHDDFFELGGHSLLAIRLVSRVRDAFGQELPLATLFQAPTIARLAGLLRQKGWTPSWATLVPMRTEGANPPLFLFHAHGGNVLEYHALLNRLDPDQPVYAFQARGLDGRVVKGSSVEDMASAYLKELRDFQPEGPYYIGGFCLGGLLALEAAQQLTAAGQKVALVVMIQSIHPASMGFKAGTTVFRRGWFRAVKRVHLELENLSYGGKGYLMERSKHSWNRARARVAIASCNLTGKQLGESSHLRMSYILETLAIEHTRAMMKYDPRPYSGDVLLFRASKQLSGLLIDEYLGWKRVVQGNLEVCEVPGHQQNMMLEPHVQRLAKELTARLKAYQQGRARAA